MRPFPALSIRNILLITISALTLFIMLLSGQEALLQWRQEATVESIRESTLVGDSMFEAGDKLSVERHVSFSILYARNQKTIEDLKPTLKDSRQKSDAAVSRMIQLLGRNKSPDLQPKINDIENRLQALKALRQQIDQTISLPVHKRDPKVASRWFKESTNMVTQIQNLWVDFVKGYADVDPIVTLQIRFKYFLWMAREYTGQEHSLIGRLIVENVRITPTEQRQLLQWHSIVNFSWENMQTLADQGRLNPALAPYLKDAQSDYDNIYSMMQDTFYMLGPAPTVPYPVNGQFWLEMATQANDSLHALKDISLRETRHYIDALEARAEKSIILHSLILLFTIALCAYSFQVVILRVLRPINVMIEALISASQGKPAPSEILQVRQEDEVGKLARVLKSFQDNALQVIETSKSLEEQKNHLKTVLATVLDAIITIDMYGKIQMANPAAERIFGYRSDEMIGQKVNMLMPKPYQDEHDSYLKHYHDTGEERIIGKGRELVARKKDGSTFPIELAVTKMVNNDQMFFVGMIRDITRRKAAEEERERYMHDLENSNRELDDFAYIASHDLKEPLRGLTTQASFLMEDYQEKLDIDAIRRLRRLVYLSQRMEKLIGDLLYFSRLGRTALAVQEIDPNETVGEVRQLMDTFLKERNANVTIPRTMPHIVCDKIKIAEVFRNLITNAVKYNAQAERLVEVGCLESVKTPQGTEKNVFYVKDNGVGIAPEFHEAVFRIFKRLEHPSVKHEEGTGSGLTFVKKIIERHKGRIWLESEPGKGSTFYFTIGAI